MTLAVGGHFDLAVGTPISSLENMFDLTLTHLFEGLRYRTFKQFYSGKSFLKYSTCTDERIEPGSKQHENQDN